MMEIKYDGDKNMTEIISMMGLTNMMNITMMERQMVEKQYGGENQILEATKSWR